MASEIVRQGLVDEMWLVVSPQNPLKDSGLWDDDFRLELARAAVREVDGVEVSDIEFGLPKPNYMIVTLETLSKRLPDREFVLVIGQDNWDCFQRWYKWEEILKRHRLIVLPRKSDEPVKDTICLDDSLKSRVRFVNTSLINVSSTWIRAELAGNPEYNGEFLPEAVWELIRMRML